MVATSTGTRNPGTRNPGTRDFDPQGSQLPAPDLLPQVDGMSAADRHQWAISKGKEYNLHPIDREALVYIAFPGRTRQPGGMASVAHHRRGHRQGRIHRLPVTVQTRGKGTNHEAPKVRRIHRLPPYPQPVQSCPFASLVQ